ncbi:hypothetical protein HK104_000904 [Borealophlyctis nickersoniae]|nr:hypothetical protein HK104_000904 [Borealophlyctis nickersoniae]
MSGSSLEADLHKRFAAVLYELRSNGMYNRANALEALVARLDVLSEGSDAPRAAEGTIELLLKNKAMVIDWNERKTLVWLLLYIADVKSKVLPKMTEISQAVLAQLPTPPSTPLSSSKISEKPATDPSPPILPGPEAYYLSDAPTLSSSMAISNPYDIYHPPELFESQPSIVGADTTLNNSSFDPSLLPQNSSKQTSSSLFGAISHASTSTSSNMWDTSVSLVLPPLPLEPTDILSIAKSPVITPADTSIPHPPEEPLDTAYADPTLPDIWASLGDDGDAEKSQLRTWEMLDPEYDPSLDDEDVSPYLTECSVEVFDAVYREHFEHGFAWEEEATVIEEAVLVKSILNLVIGVPSSIFSYSSDTLSFQLESKLRVMRCGASSVNSCISRFLAIGTHFTRLERVVAAVKSNFSRFGASGLAFSSSLTSYLSFVRACIASLQQLVGFRDMPLMQLDQALEIVGMQLQCLAALCGCSIKGTLPPDGFSLPTGASLLSHIYDTAVSTNLYATHAASKDVLSELILLALLKDSSAPYFRYLEAYLGVGSDGDDPYGEFGKNKGGIGADGDEFWDRETDAQHRPSFIPPELAEKTLHAGRCLRVLKVCAPDHPLSRMTTDRIVASSGLPLRWALKEVDVKRVRAEVASHCAELSEQIKHYEKAKQAEEDRKVAEEAEREGRRVNEMEAAFEERRARNQKRQEAAAEKKRSLKEDIDAHLTSRAAHAQSQLELELAEARRLEDLAAARDAEMKRLEELEKAQMIEEHERRMEALDKEAERLRMGGTEGEVEASAESGEKEAAGVKTERGETVGDVLFGGTGGGRFFRKGEDVEDEKGDTLAGVTTGGVKDGEGSSENDGMKSKKEVEAPGPDETASGTAKTETASSGAYGSKGVDDSARQQSVTNGPAESQNVIESTGELDPETTDTVHRTDSRHRLLILATWRKFCIIPEPTHKPFIVSYLSILTHILHPSFHSLVR